MLRRAGFKQPERVRVPVVHTPPARWREPQQVGDEVLAAPKLDLVRSPILREAYRCIPCQWPGCGREDGTVCCGHSNWLTHGKAKAMKAGDDRGAALCFTHHSALDQGSALSREERQAGWWAAHVASVRLLVALGAWPARVPVPDLSHNPFDLAAA